MKEINHYITCSNTQIQKSKIDKALLKMHYKEDCVEDQLKELAEIISYCCKNYKGEYGCQCKSLPECMLFNELILKYSILLKEYKINED